ncbi:MAG: DUF2911 domain-containing protein [Gilvibacter sp.]
MTKFYTHLVLIALVVIAGCGIGHAQITTPRGPSPQANVQQTIGLSTITVDYSRPSVRDREIYGTNLAHYGFQNLGFGTSTAAPWRAGANENTKITFSHDMTVEGKSIKAGTYGFFVAIAESGPSTVIFSNNSTAWGSFFYDESEDALRVEVATVAIPHKEALTFEFTEVTPTSTTLMLQWEKVGFPITIEVAVTDIVLANIRKSMQDQPGFNRQTWEQAAAYSMANGGDLDEALKWITGAQEGNFFSQKTFANTLTKAQILMAMEREADAMTAMDAALDTGTIFEVHQWGRTLIGAGKKDKALEVFQYNADKNEGTWPVHYGLARAYSAKGDFKNALAHLQKAHENAPNAASKGRVAANIAKLEKGEDIN